jgi:hypothetical protein
MRVTFWFLAILAAAIAGIAPVMAERATPRDGTLTYTLLRNGDAIGSASYRFKHDSRGLTVDIRARAAVKFAVFTLHRYEYDSTEVWQDGRLVTLRAHTRKDENFQLVMLRNEGAEFTVQVNGKAHKVDAGVQPATMWNEKVVEEHTLLNPQDGTAMPVTARLIGEETVQLPGGALHARHYELTATGPTAGADGLWSREVWYDAEGRLIKLSYSEADSSKIEYVLR